MEKVVFYLVRHGETELSKNDCFRGASDVELDHLGKKQAEEVGEGFKNIPIDVILSSPMKRAWYTAECIAKRKGISIRPEPAFRNIDLGPWNGKPKAIVKKESPEIEKIIREDLGWILKINTTVSPGKEKSANPENEAQVDLVLTVFRGTVVERS